MYMNHPYQVNPPKIISHASGDVNGDGITDYVFLTAVKPVDVTSPYVEQIVLNIQDGATGRMFTITIPEEGNSGYDPTIFLGDFTGNGVMDILISTNSGGSGALTYNYIYSFINNKARKLFDFNQYNEESQYTVTYLDNYKVSVKSLTTGESFLIDISNRGSDYLSQIYQEDGTLKRQVTGMFDGVSGFYPVDLDRDGIYEIQAYQRISGLYHADSFGYIINTLKWNGKEFIIWQQWFALTG